MNKKQIGVAIPNVSIGDIIVLKDKVTIPSNNKAIKINNKYNMFVIIKKVKDEYFGLLITNYNIKNVNRCILEASEYKYEDANEFSYYIYPDTCRKIDFNTFYAKLGSLTKIGVDRIYKMFIANEDLLVDKSIAKKVLAGVKLHVQPSDIIKYNDELYYVEAVGIDDFEGLHLIPQDNDENGAVLINKMFYITDFKKITISKSENFEYVNFAFFISSSFEVIYKKNLKALGMNVPKEQIVENESKVKTNTLAKIGIGAVVKKIETNEKFYIYRVTQQGYLGYEVWERKYKEDLEHKFSAGGKIYFTNFDKTEISFDEEIVQLVQATIGEIENVKSIARTLKKELKVGSVVTLDSGKMYLVDKMEDEYYLAYEILKEAPKYEYVYDIFVDDKPYYTNFENIEISKEQNYKVYSVATYRELRVIEKVKSIYFNSTSYNISKINKTDAKRELLELSFNQRKVISELKNLGFDSFQITSMLSQLGSGYRLNTLVKFIDASKKENVELTQDLIIDKILEITLI